MGPGAGTETPAIGIDVLITVAAVIAAIAVIVVLIVSIGRKRGASEDEKAVIPEVSMNEDLIAQLKRSTESPMMKKMKRSRDSLMRRMRNDP